MRKLSSNTDASKASTGTSSTSQYARSSLLGVASSTPRHRSLPGTQEGQPSPAPRASFSKKRLDPSDPSTWTSRHTPSYDERPRAASVTYSKEDLPDIRLERDVGQSSSGGSQAINLDGPGPAQVESESESGLAASNASSLPIRSEAESFSPIAKSDTGSPSYTSIPTPSSVDHGQALNVPNAKETDSRRFSNQSASFSSATSVDSERIGRISQDSERDTEEALQDTSGSESESSSDESDREESADERGRQRRLRRKSTSPARKDDEASSPKTPPSPEIRVTDVSSDQKQEHPHPPEHSGTLSEAQPKRFAPKSGVARASSPAALSPEGDDDAELRRAKELVLRTSPMDETVKDRSVKMIIRGEWEAFQDIEDEPTEVRHEPRLYLVCSDLSSEASHALEWTVGTLLKDGDTLLIINAIEDENAPKHLPDQEPTAELRREHAKAAQEATATMESLTRQTTNQEGKLAEPKPAQISSIKDARSVSRGSKPRPRRDAERADAVLKLEQDFLKFVRRTTLQVRTMIEVLHCRSPRHLILNAIDELEPTLVVVGTRGQSSIQGVMMGSFSNYLVTKSSIPVMVARRRLKKPHHAKVSSQQIRMTNNLVPFGVRPKRKSLTQARID